ncbi:Membrane lipoprotein [Tripterygium wilfordii]|uniref:non-specific serine/threonine protein kinase n=1 Tax=Tripterygium wilfordii TaxID=458696 RepID=A0A7J7CVR7_TRIWF|nr:uncharacterized protein LOC120013726 [Tripterygium wilfordii]KAF5737996.1 Membrane lipoprotein [Tripterygium wilfordii]
MSSPPPSPPLFIIIFFITLFNSLISYSYSSSAQSPACNLACGSLQVKYPFGTGYGCGSPRFHPYVTCSADQLLLQTHTGLYPITSISYTTSTLTITPPCMSTCTSMEPSSNLGLDWASPFQLGPSTFLLLSCTPATSSLTINSSPVCDTSSSHLCASIYTCPSVIGLGLPLFPPTNTCCVYSPANFDSRGELDLRKLKCDGYVSVVSFRDYPTDPTLWEYGVVLKYTRGAFDDYYMDTKCNTCEASGGVCGYETTSGGNSFVCVCSDGVNATSDCNSFSQIEGIVWSKASLPNWNIWIGTLAGLIFWIAA